MDFSPGSDVALGLAAKLAASTQAQLLVVHAFYLAPLGYTGNRPLPPPAIEGLIDGGKQGLAESVAEAKQLGAKTVSARLLDGLPWKRIVSVAREEASDLIVIGTQGRTGFARFTLGSVAESVVRHAQCSVLVARAGADAPPFRRILCPIDFSDISREAVRQAAELLPPDGRLTLMHAVQLPSTYRGAGLAPELLSEAERTMKQELQRWAAHIGPHAKTSISSTLGIGSPATQALALFEEDPAYDLIAVGSHGRTGIRRAVLGSVAEKIVRHAPCSVLVARHRDQHP